MAKKVNKRPAPSGPAAGNARRGSRAAKEPARTLLPANGSPPLVCASYAVLAQAPYDTMAEVTTYVYDAQNRLTRIEDPGPAPSPLAPDRQEARGPKQRSSGKRANAKTPKKQ
jgi:hypothetical protein